MKNPAGASIANSFNEFVWIDVSADFCLLRCDVIVHCRLDSCLNRRESHCVTLQNVIVHVDAVGIRRRSFGMNLIGQRSDFLSGQIILNFLQKRCRRQRASGQECVYVHNARRRRIDRYVDDGRRD